jgi:hypothetical protein
VREAVLAAPGHARTHERAIAWSGQRFGQVDRELRRGQDVPDVRDRRRDVDPGQLADRAVLHARDAAEQAREEVRLHSPGAPLQLGARPARAHEHVVGRAERLRHLAAHLEPLRPRRARQHREARRRDHDASSSASVRLR